MAKFICVAFLMLVNSFVIADTIISGDQGFGDNVMPAPENESFEASTAVWGVHIGGVDRSCANNGGTFPIGFRWYSGQTLNYGLIRGNIPTEYDDLALNNQLCNGSVALLIRDNAFNTTLNGLRIHGAYDGIRQQGSVASDFAIEQSWLSDIRSTCLENLSGVNATISDSVFENCFHGINLGSNDISSPDHIVSIDQLLLSVKGYKLDPVSDELTSGNVFIGTANEPSLTISNSTFAYSDPVVFNGVSSILKYIGKESTTLQSCVNNRLLWMADDQPPPAFNDVAQCFEIITGAHAVVQWKREHCRWIREHEPVRFGGNGELRSRRFTDIDPDFCEDIDVDKLVKLTPDIDVNSNGVIDREEVIYGFDNDPGNQEGNRFLSYASDVVYDASQNTFLLNNCTVGDPDLYPGNPDERDLDGAGEMDQRTEIGCAYLLTERDDEGRRPLNRYPIMIRGEKTTLLHPRVVGEVPQDSGFQFSYLNSAAIMLNTEALNSKIYGARIDKSWDAIRVKADNFIISDVYSTDARDDCIENDFYKSGKILDSLFDGCNAGISIRNKDIISNAEDTNLIEIDGLLMRLKPHKTTRDIFTTSPVREGSLHIFKASSNSPSVSIHNSTFAYDTDNILGANQLSTMLSEGAADEAFNKLKGCSNNKILWMADDAPHPHLLNLPECFELLTGAIARRAWEQARCDWINNHSQRVTRRLEGEVDSCRLPIISRIDALTNITSADTLRLTAVIENMDNEELNDQDILWFSSLDGILRSAEGGVVSGDVIEAANLSVGVHEIRVQVTNAAGDIGHAEFIVTVTAPIATLTLQPEQVVIVNAGDNIGLTALLNGDDPAHYDFRYRLKMRNTDLAWNELRPYDISPNYGLDTSALLGKYRVQVIARHRQDNSIKYKASGNIEVIE